MAVTIAWQGQAWKRGRVFKVWRKRHFVLLSNGRLFQAPGTIELEDSAPSEVETSRSRVAPAFGERGESKDDDDDTVAKPPQRAVVSVGASSGVGCGSSERVVTLPISDYDARVRFVVTTDSFLGDVSDGGAHMLKLSNEDDLVLKFASRAQLERCLRALKRIRKARAAALLAASRPRRATTPQGDGDDGDDGGGGPGGTIGGRPRSVSESLGVKQDHSTIPASKLQQMTAWADGFDVAAPTPRPLEDRGAAASPVALTRHRVPNRLDSDASADSPEAAPPAAAAGAGTDVGAGSGSRRGSGGNSGSGTGGGTGNGSGGGSGGSGSGAGTGAGTGAGGGASAAASSVPSTPVGSGGTFPIRRGVSGGGGPLGVGVGGGAGVGAAASGDVALRRIASQRGGRLPPLRVEESPPLRLVGLQVPPVVGDCGFDVVKTVRLRLGQVRDSA
jgi:hypothetical protein